MTLPSQLCLQRVGLIASGFVVLQAIDPPALLAQIPTNICAFGAAEVSIGFEQPLLVSDKPLLPLEADGLAWRETA